MNQPLDPTNPGSGPLPALPGPRSLPPPPSRDRRFFLVILAAVTGLSLLVGIGLVAAYRAGSVVIDVKEHGRHGDNVHLRIPAALGHVALAFAPDVSFSKHGGDPSLRDVDIPALVREIERVPDGTVLVQVDSPRERVRIVREHGSFLVHVESEDENVRVEVPMKLAGAFLKRMEQNSRTI